VKIGVPAAVNMNPFIIRYLQSRLLGGSKSFESYHTTTVMCFSMKI
jgi:hypothetical protein